MPDYKPNEMMTIAAARALKNDDICFVGIGQPSAACNLARDGPIGRGHDPRSRDARPPLRPAVVSASFTVTDKSQQGGLKFRRSLGNLVEKKRAADRAFEILGEHRGNSRMRAVRISRRRE